MHYRQMPTPRHLYNKYLWTPIHQPLCVSQNRWKMEILVFTFFFKAKVILVCALHSLSPTSPLGLSFSSWLQCSMALIWISECPWSICLFTLTSCTSRCIEMALTFCGHLFFAPDESLTPDPVSTTFKSFLFYFILPCDNHFACNCHRAYFERLGMTITYQCTTLSIWNTLFSRIKLNDLTFRLDVLSLRNKLVTHSWFRYHS